MPVKQITDWTVFGEIRAATATFIACLAPMIIEYLTLRTILSRDFSHVFPCITLYYCALYSAIPPLMAAMVLNEISCQ